MSNIDIPPIDFLKEGTQVIRKFSYYSIKNCFSQFIWNKVMNHLPDQEHRLLIQLHPFVVGIGYIETDSPTIRKIKQLVKYRNDEHHIAVNWRRFINLSTARFSIEHFFTISNYYRTNHHSNLEVVKDDSDLETDIAIWLLGQSI